MHAYTPNPTTMIPHHSRSFIRTTNLLKNRLSLSSTTSSPDRFQPRRNTSSRTHAQQLSSQAQPPPPPSSHSTWWSTPTVAISAALGAVASAFALNQFLSSSDRSSNSSNENNDSTNSSNFTGIITSNKKSTWISEVRTRPGALKVLDAEALLAQEHPFLEDDHMFSAFVARGIIRDLEGYYFPSLKQFSAIICLGREVAGFPRVVHGGLTAAIFDEAFGGLLFSLKKDGNVATAWGPCYTVALEVAYKHKIPAGATVLCTAELESMEGRKMWFKAKMSDGPEGKTYATARALFVAPRPHRMAWDVIKYIGRVVKEKVGV